MKKKTFLFNGDIFIICNIQENLPVGNIVDEITNCKTHLPERDINFGCPFGSVNTRKKTVPGCKIYMLQVMVTWSKGALFTGHEASIYFVGCNVNIAFIRSTSDEETF